MTLDELITKLQSLKELAGTGDIPVTVFDSASCNIIEEWDVHETYDYAGEDEEDAEEFIDGIKIFVR